MIQQIVVGMLLIVATAAIGGLISDAWQRRNWLFQQRTLHAQTAYENKIRIIHTLFGILRDRITASYNYAIVISQFKDTEIHGERAKYRLIVDRWNSEFPVLVTEMKYIFGRETAYRFDKYFPPEFAHVDRLLRQARTDVEAGSTHIDHILNEISGRLYLINFHSNETSGNLYSRTENEKTIIQKEPDIKFSNRENLSHTYLLKSLLKPRTNF